MAGKAALGHARAALAATDALTQAGEVTDPIRGRLTDGMLIGCTLTLLFDALDGVGGDGRARRVAARQGTAVRVGQAICGQPLSAMRSAPANASGRNMKPL